MDHELTPHELTPEERRWLRSRLAALLASPAGAAGPDPALVEQAVADLLGALLQRRAAQAEQAGPARRGPAQERDPRRRVVITGLGIISALGLAIGDYWDSLVHGRSGISGIESYDVRAFRTKIAGEIKRWDAAPWIPARAAKRLSRATQFVVAAARQALQDSGFPLPAEGTDELGVLIGSGTTAFPKPRSR